MNISLILTRQCPLRCRYCFETHGDDVMSRETAFAAIDMAARSGDADVGISFFGGEPLLKKELIRACVDYAARYTPIRFHYNMTTNGLLLDEAFLAFARDHRIMIALSHDGEMSRGQRVYADGRDCLPLLDEKLDLLLRWQPDALVMATVTPATAPLAAASVTGLFARGVRRVNLALDDRPQAGWGQADMDVLAVQLDRMAEDVLTAFRRGQTHCLINFEEKILSVMRGTSCHVCRLGKRKPYVDWDGKIYPCIQFGGVAAYEMGDVFHGIDPVRQAEIYARSQQKPAFCRDCALAARCVNDCACLNFQQCGRMDEVSPVQCAWQRLLIRCADRLAQDMIEADAERAARRFLRGNRQEG